MKVTIKARNWHAVNAHFRKAGSMKDRKKEVSKKACRGAAREHQRSKG